MVCALIIVAFFYFKCNLDRAGAGEGQTAPAAGVISLLPQWRLTVKAVADQ